MIATAEAIEQAVDARQSRLDLPEPALRDRHLAFEECSDGYWRSASYYRSALSQRLWLPVQAGHCAARRVRVEAQPMKPGAGAGHLLPLGAAASMGRLHRINDSRQGVELRDGTVLLRSEDSATRQATTSPILAYKG
jgi:hypothetical protein